MSEFSTISSWVTGTLFPEATLFTVCFFLTVQAPASSPSLPVLLRARDDSTLESCRFCPGARPFGKLAHSHPESKLVQTLATSLCAKLQASKEWTSTTIIQVLEKLDQASLPNDLKKTIQDAIDQIDLAGTGHLKTVIAGQHIEGFSHYVSKEDWARMDQAPANTVHTMSIIASRLRSMGFVSLKEATKVEAMSVVFFCLVHKGQQPQPSPQTRYALVEEFAAVFAKTPPGTVPSANRFPANPAKLGKAWLDQVYGADEPAMVSIAGGWKSMVT